MEGRICWRVEEGGGAERREPTLPDKQQYLGPLVLFRGLWRKYKMTEYTQLSQLLQISLFQEDFFSDSDFS